MCNEGSGHRVFKARMQAKQQTGLFSVLAHKYSQLLTLPTCARVLWESYPPDQPQPPPETIETGEPRASIVSNVIRCGRVLFIKF